MKKCSALFVVFVMVIVTGCTSGKKALQKGQYPDAVFQAVERLRNNPESKNSIQTLQQAYPLAIETLSHEIEQLLKSNDRLKFSTIVERYELMSKMGQEIRHCPAALAIIPDPQSYQEQLSAARQKAAPEAYNLGIRLLEDGTRGSAREAFYQFLNADRFVPGFQDVAKKIEQARFKATLKVLVESIPVPGRYKLSSDFFYDNVLGFLEGGIKNEFLEFYTPGEARSLPYIDEILVLEFEDFVVGAVNEKESEKDCTSTDSVKVGTATVNGQKVDVYNRVKAKFLTHRREVVSTGILGLRIIDSQTQKAIANRKFPGTFTWVSEWANFNGDERALTPQQIEMTKKKPLLPPPQQDLFLEFTKPIFDQLKGYLRNHYREGN